MKEHYVTYEQADKLKKFGFDEPCEFYYNPCRELRVSKDCLLSPKITNKRFIEAIAGGMATAPRLDQAQAWLREEKGWHIQVRINGVRYAYWYEIWSTIPNGPVYGTPDDDTFRRGQYETYDEALSAGIDKTLELLGDNTQISKQYE